MVCLAAWVWVNVCVGAKGAKGAVGGLIVVCVCDRGGANPAKVNPAAGEVGAWKDKLVVDGLKDKPVWPGELRGDCIFKPDCVPEGLW